MSNLRGENTFIRQKLTQNIRGIYREIKQGSSRYLGLGLLQESFDTLICRNLGYPNQWVKRHRATMEHTAMTEHGKQNIIMLQHDHPNGDNDGTSNNRGAALQA